MRIHGNWGSNVGTFRNYCRYIIYSSLNERVSEIRWTTWELVRASEPNRSSVLALWRRWFYEDSLGSPHFTFARTVCWINNIIARCETGKRGHIKWVDFPMMLQLSWNVNTILFTLLHHYFSASEWIVKVYEYHCSETAPGCVRPMAEETHEACLEIKDQF